MILVAGGTGRLGSELVRRLTVQGERVRVLTRDPARAAHLTGAEGVVGDVRNPADLSAAVQDVAAVVSAITGSFGEGHVTPANVDRDGNANHRPSWRLPRAVPGFDAPHRHQVDPSAGLRPRR
jgi:uncharacterized protein YbjT (DUF2867 family)